MKRAYAAPLFWGVSIGSLAAVDLALAAGEADGDTLSEVTRAILPSPVFVGLWAGLSAWIIPHIVRGYQR